MAHPRYSHALPLVKIGTEPSVVKTDDISKQGPVLHQAWDSKIWSRELVAKAEFPDRFKILISKIYIGGAKK